MEWKKIKDPTIYDLHRWICEGQDKTEDDSKKAVLGEILDKIHDIMRAEERRCL